MNSSGNGQIFRFGGLVAAVVALIGVFVSGIRLLGIMELSFFDLFNTEELDGGTMYPIFFLVGAIVAILGFAIGKKVIGILGSIVILVGVGLFYIGVIANEENMGLVQGAAGYYMLMIGGVVALICGIIYKPE